MTPYTRILFIFAILFSTISCAAISIPKATSENVGHTLGAATRGSSLAARSDDLGVSLKHKVELIYADGNNFDGEKNYAAKVSISSKNPILVLEEIEHLIDDLKCGPNEITLSAPSFSDISVLERLSNLRDGHIVTSHVGCNAVDERQVYKVLDVEIVSISSVTFSTVPVSFKSAFHPIEVELGYTEYAHELRSRSVARSDIARQTLSLDGLSAIDKILVNKPDNIPVTLSCKNCTLWGAIELQFANFAWNCDMTDIFDEIDSPSDCISGQASAIATGVGARVELEASIPHSWQTDIALLPASLSPSVQVRIPGIGYGTWKYGPFIDLGYEMDGNVDFSYGFEMTIPDGAKAWLDVEDPSKSGATGFECTNVEAIPFQSQTEIQRLGLRASLRSEISVAFSFDDVMDVSGSGNATVYVDTPILRADVTPVENVDPQCRPLSPAIRNSKEYQQILTNVIRVNFSSAWDFGYYLGAEISIPDVYHGPLGHPLGWNTTFLPTNLGGMCLNFDEKTLSYETAEQAVLNARRNPTVSARDRIGRELARTWQA